MNIQAVVRRTGVPAATLRKWEERYGVPAPARTNGAQRRYEDREVRQIEWLRDRLAEGLRIGQAVALLRRNEPVETPEGVRDAIVDALLEHRPTKLEALVNQAFWAFPPTTTITGIVEPVLHRTGELWEQNRISVADEHLLAQLFATKVRGIVDATSSGSAGCAVLACVPGERHEIGLLCLAALLQGDGWGVLYLGQDTPVRQAFELAADVEARFVGLSATMSGPGREAAPALDSLEEEFPSFRVLRGGAAFGGISAARVTRSLRKMRRRAAAAT